LINQLLNILGFSWCYNVVDWR